MPQFTVDDDLAALVERLAKPKPFENLSFNAALRRVLNSRSRSGQEWVELTQSSSDSLLKKTPSPSARDWVLGIPELKGKRGLHTWQSICDALEIKTTGDSARRKLKKWVQANRPTWPPVPDIEGEV